VRVIRRTAVLLAVVLALPACGSEATIDSATPTATVSDEADDVDAAEGETEDLGAAEQVGALEETELELVLTDVRSRMSPRRAGVAAVYLDIENPTDHDDALVAASVPPEVAAVVEVHETYVKDAEDGTMDGASAHDDGAMDGVAGHGDGGVDAASEHGGSAGDAAAGDEGMGMMGMREVASIAIPTGETVELVPGGYHIMLIDLVRDLDPGDTFEVTLVFERAGERTVTAEVREQA
jgi:copper(I)-binding protein